MIGSAERERIIAATRQKLQEVGTMLFWLRENRLEENSTIGPETAQKSMKRQQRDVDRQQKIRDVQAMASIKIGEIRRKMGR